MGFYGAFESDIIFIYLLRGAAFHRNYNNNNNNMSLFTKFGIKINVKYIFFEI
jgi:hypothetical protein